MQLLVLAAAAAAGGGGGVASGTERHRLPLFMTHMDPGVSGVMQLGGVKAPGSRVVDVAIWCVRVVGVASCGWDVECSELLISQRTSGLMGGLALL